MEHWCYAGQPSEVACRRVFYILLPTFHYFSYTKFLKYLHANVSYYAEIGTTKEIGDVCTWAKKKET